MRRAGRVHGLVLVLGIVLLGILPGAGYLHWRAPKVRAEIEKRMANAPRQPVGRLDEWMKYGGPYIQVRLTQLRMSTRQPWLVTHTVELPGAEAEIWGIDVSSSSPGTLVRDGLRVELHLPAPRVLGLGALFGDNAHRVPRYSARERVRDPALRAIELVRWFLSGISEALPEEIPGAELAIVIDPADPVPEEP